MKRFKLKDDSPTKIKFDKLVDLAIELGISIEFDGCYCVLTDEARPGLRFFVEEECESSKSFPPYTEANLIIEK
jgi:hypothetical protein